ISTAAVLRSPHRRAHPVHGRAVVVGDHPTVVRLRPRPRPALRGPAAGWLPWEGRRPASHRDGPAWSHPRMDDPAVVRPRGLLRRASRSPGLDLWIEGRVNDNGYGTVLKQVPWRHGTTLDQEDPRACDHLP